MVANPERRALVCDAALEVLGRDGARSLTHRAVDAEARLPQGTCANYFSSRSALLAGMAERLFVVFAPDGERLDEIAALPVGDAGPAYVAYGLERLLERPSLARAWIELRLEAARSAELAELVGAVVRGGFEANVRFCEERGLPGGREAVLLLHHLVDGMALDALTIPMDDGSRREDRIRTAAARILRASPSFGTGLDGG